MADFVFNSQDGTEEHLDSDALVARFTQPLRERDNPSSKDLSDYANGAYRRLAFRSGFAVLPDAAQLRRARDRYVALNHHAPEDLPREEDREAALRTVRNQAQDAANADFEAAYRRVSEAFRAAQERHDQYDARDAAEHADEYAEMLDEFHAERQKRNAKAQLRQEIMGIEDEGERDYFRSKYARLWED